ncbi:MAG: hypothetical protein OXD46_02080 [Chloroflexi bacterium]|nr:hypothetical protein [Chloroflexota bacterium]
MAAYYLASKKVQLQETDDPIEFYFEQGWTDGLPVVPPTAEKIGAFLDAVGRSPSEILGTEPVRGRVVTVEKVAINAVMAGCRPEYFSVVLATIEAMLEPEHNLHAVTVSTMGAAPLLVVNGPIVNEAGLNSGVSVFGPGNRANATIGRAVRLTIMNVTGAVPGDLDQSSLGHAGKYTWCIAEDEETSPWQALHVDRGYASSQSTVTVFPGLSPIQVSNFGGGSPEAALMGVSDGLIVAGPGNAEIVVVLTPETITHIKAGGWWKEQVAKFLWEQSRRPAGEWEKHGYPTGNADADELLAVTDSWEGITVIVAGGKAGSFSAVIPLWGGGSNSRSVSKVISS